MYKTGDSRTIKRLVMDGELFTNCLLVLTRDHKLL